MKIIFKIARAELRTLFYSPVAWVTIVAFFVMSGIFFVSPLRSHAIEQDLMLVNSPSWRGFKGPLTFNMFIGTFITYIGYVYLFVPLLTMGVINREETSGTMRLLSSSPVRIREIVLGKFAGLMVFNLVLLSSLALLMFTGYFSIEHSELKWFLSMLLGIFLLTSAFMAIGLFVSSLTSYQIVAGISTFLGLFILGSMNKLWQDYDFVRDLTWFLSLKGRVEPFLHGLITTRDFLYFILIIALFLGLTMIRLKSKQESKKWTVSFYRNIGLIGLVLLMGYFSSRPGYVGYLDVTSAKRQTLDSATQAVLKELDGSPLKVTLYGNLLGFNMIEAMPRHRNEYIWHFWEKYMRFYPNIKFEYVNYYKVNDRDTAEMKQMKKNEFQVAEQFAKLFHTKVSRFLKPDEITKRVDQSGEDEYRLLMELEYKGKKTFLRTYVIPTWPDQPAVSGSLRRLTQPPVPMVLFTTGHYERSPRRYNEREFGGHTRMQSYRIGLINQGIDSDTIDLSTADIPAHTSVLAIADPRSAFEPVELEKIRQFVAKGGNLFVYGEPGKQDLLNPLLNEIGVNLDKGRIVSPAKHSQTDVFGVEMTKAGNLLTREPAMQAAQIGNGGAGANFMGACNISYRDTAGFTVKPILSMPGKKNIWIEQGYYRDDSVKPDFSLAEGDLQKDEYIFGVTLSRKIHNKEQRIAVLSDADVMTSTMNYGTPMGVGIYSWLVYNKYPVYTKNITPKDIRLTIGKQGANVLWYVYVYILPGALLLTGTILLIRRKRK